MLWDECSSPSGRNALDTKHYNALSNTIAKGRVDNANIPRNTVNMACFGD